MRTTLFILSLITAMSACGQTELLTKYRKADSLLADNLTEAYQLLKEVEAGCDKSDTLYTYSLWYSVVAASELEKQSRMNEEFESSLKYGTEALQLIEKGKAYFDEQFAAREYWMHKNLVVTHFGLGQLEEAEKHKAVLYEAYQKKQLPEGLHQYFNFTFFKWEDKNVWGYEWYPELGDPETEGSFSKIVYYVYSTNPDGSDNEQLYRLHVLKFHKFGNDVKFDYVLTKRLETAKNEVNGTLYAYTYTKKIDYVKLQADILEVLKGNYEPDTKTINKKP